MAGVVCGLEAGQREGEDRELPGHAWTWTPTTATQTSAGTSVQLSLLQSNTQIMFHPTYSAGTAAILGSAELEYPLHHYWEVEILSPMYGTDVMVGLASSQADTASHSHSFESLLGLDTESWGFSYQGFTQHDGIKKKYGRTWDKGATVGVHYDSWRGTLEFLVDKVSCGIAWTGVGRGKKLFPAVCSTAAKSEMRLVTAQSFRNTLQFHCVQRLASKLGRSAVQPHGRIRLPPGLNSFIENNYWFLLRPRRVGMVVAPDTPASAPPQLRSSKRKRTEKAVESQQDASTEEDSDDDCFLDLRSRKVLVAPGRRPLPSSSSSSGVGTSRCPSPELPDLTSPPRLTTKKRGFKIRKRK